MCVVVKMADDVHIVMSFLCCFVAWGIPYMHSFSFENFLYFSLLFCFVLCRGGGGDGKRKRGGGKRRKKEGGGGGGRRGGLRGLYSCVA